MTLQCQYYDSVLDLPARLIRHWNRLVDNSPGNNVFLSPGFVLPAIKHLPDTQTPHALTIIDQETNQLLGLGLLVAASPTRRIPFPHWRTFKSIHSFRSGLLVDKGSQLDVWNCLCNAMHASDFPYKAILIRDHLLTEQKTIWDHQEEHGTSVQQTPIRDYLSPALICPEDPQQYQQTKWSSSRRKSIRRTRKKLAEQGEIQLEVTRAPEAIFDALESFLYLEHLSWKAEMGSSIKSRPEEEQFILEMVHELALENRCAITELKVDKRVVAAAINLIAGERFFAFKIGWDPEFSDYSPGSLHEVEILNQSNQEFQGINIFDSCAKEDSYISRFWTDQLHLGDVLLTADSMTSALAKSVQGARAVKREVKDLLNIFRGH